MKRNLILLALATLMVVGCDERKPDGSFDTSRSINFETIVIDSCEYIQAWYKLSHKGNCRFCAERRKQELKELVEQLKEK